MKRNLNNKPFIVIISVIVLIIIAYIVQGVYFGAVGSIKTQYIYESTESETAYASGFVVRSEARNSDGKNTAILFKNDNKVYLPAVEQGENVAKGNNIAYVFDTMEQAKNYEKSNEIKEKINLLNQLINNKNLNYVDVSALNGQIVNAVNEYMDALDAGYFSNLSSLIDNINYKTTSRQIITDSKINLSKQIKQLEKEKAALDSSISSAKTVTAPFPGCFYSLVDGYEAEVDYSTIEKKDISAGQINKLMKKTLMPNKNAFGKIVDRSVWYFMCNIKKEECKNLRTNKMVEVNFYEKGIEPIQMQVLKINRSDKKEVAVLLKCTNMDKDYVSLRKEQAIISFNKYTGFKIDADAVDSDADGQTGVYVYAGNTAVFKPIVITFATDDYVLAVSPESYKDNQKLRDRRKLKAYDQVITKRRNIYDGKIIS